MVLATADPPEVIGSLLEEYDLEALVLDDSRGALIGQFGIRALPSGFLFDREGVMIDVMEGWHQENSLPEWKEKVEDALK